MLLEEGKSRCFAPFTHRKALTSRRQKRRTSTKPLSAPNAPHQVQTRRRPSPQLITRYLESMLSYTTQRALDPSAPYLRNWVLSSVRNSPLVWHILLKLWTSFSYVFGSRKNNDLFFGGEWVIWAAVSTVWLPSSWRVTCSHGTSDWVMMISLLLFKASVTDKWTLLSPVCLYKHGQPNVQDGASAHCERNISFVMEGRSASSINVAGKLQTNIYHWLHTIETKKTGIDLTLKKKDVELVLGKIVYLKDWHRARRSTTGGCFTTESEIYCCWRLIPAVYLMSLWRWWLLSLWRMTPYPKCWELVFQLSSAFSTVIEGRLRIKACENPRWIVPRKDFPKVLRLSTATNPSTLQLSKLVGLDTTALRSSFAALELRRPQLVAWSFIVLPYFPILRVPINDSNCFEAVPFHHAHNKQPISNRALQNESSTGRKEKAPRN